MPADTSSPTKGKKVVAMIGRGLMAMWLVGVGGTIVLLLIVLLVRRECHARRRRVHSPGATNVVAFLGVRLSRGEFALTDFDGRRQVLVTHDQPDQEPTTGRYL